MVFKITLVWLVKVKVLIYYVYYVPKLYPLKTPEKLCFSSVFRCNKMRTLTKKAYRSCPKEFCEKSVLPQNSQENTSVRVSFWINFIEKEIPTLVFPCEFSEIFENTFFYRTHLVATSEMSLKPCGPVYKSLSNIYDRALLKKNLTTSASS